MAIDSFHMIQEFHNHNTIDSCSCMCDSLSMNHWYNFYKDEYASLISTHAGLFGALITAAVTIFCVKFFYDKLVVEKKIDEILNNYKKEYDSYKKENLNKIEGTLKDYKKDFDSYKEENLNKITNLESNLNNLANNVMREYRIRLLFSEIALIKKDDVAKANFAIDEFLYLLKKDNKRNVNDLGDLAQNIINKLTNFSESILKTIQI